MKLLTKAIIEQLPSLSEITTLSPDTLIQCKFFFIPGGAWYVLYGNEEPNGDWRFYGYATLGEDDDPDAEYGYFMLSELESLKGPYGLRVERDLHFPPVPIREITDKKKTRRLDTSPLPQ